MDPGFYPAAAVSQAGPKVGWTKGAGYYGTTQGLGMVEQGELEICSTGKCSSWSALPLFKYEGDPNADGAMTMLYHLCVGGVNSVICGCRMVSTCPDSQVHKVIQHALHRQHWDPPRIMLKGHRVGPTTLTSR